MHEIGAVWASSPRLCKTRHVSCCEKEHVSQVVLTIPEMASAAAASLCGKLRANNRGGGGGGKARNAGAWERNRGITITRNQSRTV
jgi:hypothetical protein